MLRVLMVLEDYGELMFLQTVLKKIGFDVDSIQNSRQFQDATLRMNPDVLVMTAYGKRIKGLELSQGVRKTRGTPHIILLKTPGASQEAASNVEAWLDSPVSALTLLNAIGDLCGLDKNVLADKFQKLRLQEKTEEEARILKMKEGEEAQMERAANSSGNFLADSTLSDDDRESRYKKFLAAERPAKMGFGAKVVQDQVKALRHAESSADLADLERQRKEFVEHLFKKKDE